MAHKDSDSEILISREILKNLSSQDFLNFGAQQIAYIRKIKVDGVDSYAVHAGDAALAGRPLRLLQEHQHVLPRPDQRHPGGL